MLRRGYIMLEALIGGGIVSVALATTFAIIAGARVDASAAIRRAEASALAIGTADRLMASTSTAGQSPTAVGTRGLRVGYTIVPNSAHALSTPQLTSASPIDRITVTVEFPTQRGTDTLTYERLRRRVP